MSHTVNDHFTNKFPIVREMYDRLLVALRKLGPVLEDPKKTSIHLVNTTALAGVYTRKEYIRLEFKSDSPIESPRITSVLQLSRNRFHHVTSVRSAEDIDGELLGWLKRAYDLSA